MLAQTGKDGPSQPESVLDLLKMGKGGYLGPKHNYSDAENKPKSDHQRQSIRAAAR